MKIAFVYNGAENLGIEYLSAFLKSHKHSTRLFFDPAVFSSDVFVNNRMLARLLNVDRKIVSGVVSWAPDLVAFSAYTGNYQWCLSIARAIKECSDVPIVFGGVHTTAVPDVVLKNTCVDFAIIGEGEHAMLDLVNHLANPSQDGSTATPNMCFVKGDETIINQPRPYIENLDSLPGPDKRMFFDKEPLFLNNPYMIITSRGCPFACSYCCNNLLHSLYEDERCHIRRRSPGHVLKELVEARSFSDRIRSVAFVDDIFTNSKAWLEEFIPKYKTHVNLPFYCNIHSAGFSLEKARLLKDGGCQLVIVGVQSGSERIRRDIFLRRETNESILQAVGYLKAVGIRFAVDHIFGAPGETNEDLEQSFDFYKQIQPDMLQSFWLTYYPGTDIIKTARKQGLLSAEDVHRINDGNIGFAHGVGCVDRERIPLCKQYELFFGLCTLIRNPRTLTLLCSIFRWMPFKKVVSLCIYTVVGLKHFRPWVLNKFRYAFSAHTAP